MFTVETASAFELHCTDHLEELPVVDLSCLSAIAVSKLRVCVGPFCVSHSLHQLSPSQKLRCV